MTLCSERHRVTAVSGCAAGVQRDREKWGDCREATTLFFCVWLSLLRGASVGEQMYPLVFLLLTELRVGVSWGTDPEEWDRQGRECPLWSFPAKCLPERKASIKP